VTETELDIDTDITRNSDEAEKDAKREPLQIKTTTDIKGDLEGFR